jgi:hypothetical protein
MVVVLATFLLVAVVVGVIWPHLVGTVTVTRTDSGTVIGEADLAHRFDNDAWYVVLGAASAFVLGIVLTAWRRSNEVVTVLAVVAGALLASWVSAEVGAWAGPEDPQKVLAHAKVGDTAPDQVMVASNAAYLVWPIAAAAGALVVLLRLPERDTPDPD